MNDSLYREFRFDEKSLYSLMPLLRMLWKQAVIPLINQGKTVLVTITTTDAKRNDLQNRRYWGHVLRFIAEQAWVDGHQYNKDVWHEHYARKYGVCEDMVLPWGEVVSRRKSTTEMLVGEFADYMSNIEANAAIELGVSFQ